MSELPPEAERLLASRPEEFVSDRERIVRELREAGRSDDARAAASLRKPPAVVLAVNRAARDRPQAAHDAARAAEDLAKSQLSGDADVYRQSLKDLEDALALLAEVAVAQLSREKPASESVRRRVADLLRASAADRGTREALARGALRERSDAAGFAAFAGMTPPAGGHRKAPGTTKREDRSEKARRDRKRRLREELARAEKSLETAERSLAAAERERNKAARAVASVSEKLERLTSG
jgi:hypothetical protein